MRQDDRAGKNRFDRLRAISAKLTSERIHNRVNGIERDRFPRLAPAGNEQRIRLAADAIEKKVEQRALARARRTMQQDDARLSIFRR